MSLLNFVLNLEDCFSPKATAASKALREMETELASSKRALATYQAQLSRANTLGDVEGHRKYTKLVEDARKRTFELQDALLAMPQAAGQASGALEGVAGTLGAVAGPAVAVIAVVVGLTTALGGLAVEGVRTALEVNEINERLTATFDALGAVPGEGQKTLAFLDELSTKLPQTRDQLAKWATQYEAIGITDLSELRNQIRATAAAQAIAGNEGAEAYKAMAERIRLAVEEHKGLKLGERTLKQLYAAGVNVTDVARRMGISTSELASELKRGTADATKFGNAIQESLLAKGKKPLDAMSNSVEALEAKAKETFDHLFDGIDTTPIVAGFRDLVDIMDQANPSGKALHDGITGALQGVITWLGKAEHEAKVFFLRVELYAVTHKPAIDLVSFAFKSMGTSIMLAADALDRLFSYASPPDWMTHLLSLGGTGNALTGAALGPAGAVAPAHAEGGLVGKPAAGEFFASVAPGEMILPQRAVREIAGAGIGPVGRETVAGGGGSVHIDHLSLTIQAPNGVTDASQISATGLALALERYRLASGR